MERGVIAGGVLIAASLLLAVLFNHSAVQERARMHGTDTQALKQGVDVKAAPPASRVLDDRVGSNSSGDDPRCCKPGDESCVDRKAKEAQGREPRCQLR